MKQTKIRQTKIIVARDLEWDNDHLRLKMLLRQDSGYWHTKTLCAEPHLHPLQNCCVNKTYTRTLTHTAELKCFSHMSVFQRCHTKGSWIFPLPKLTHWWRLMKFVVTDRKKQIQVRIAHYHSMNQSYGSKSNLTATKKHFVYFSCSL